MASLISVLPAEVWDRIFSLITSRKDIGACRLACRSFRELSSPYLITQTCFAARLDTLNKLYDVMEHPYFSQFVTELIYDTSAYDARCEDPDAYANARLDSELEFESLTMIHQDRSSLFRRVLQHPIPYEEVREGIENAIVEDEAPVEYSGELGNSTPSGDIPWQRNWYGIVEYNERVSEQRSLTEHGRFYSILQQALVAFPRLKHMVFADYRNLAREDEDYARCCTRLFGSEMLPPRLLSDPPLVNWEKVDHIDNTRRWNKLFEFILELGDSEIRPRSLIIGSNKWSVAAGVFEPPGASSTELATMQLLPLAHPWERELPGLERLEALSIPLHTGLATYKVGNAANKVEKLATDLAASPLPHVLGAVTSTLKYLDLGAVDLMRSLAEGPEVWRLAEYGLGLCTLRLILFHLHFPCLQYLKLSGWSIEGEQFLRFLDGVKNTLEFLELRRNMICHINSSIELAKRGGSQMSLKGVVIEQEEFHQANSGRKTGLADPSVRRDPGCERLWLEGRNNML